MASGNWQQYKVSELKTPDEGDTIEYTLVITAEDAFGNKGEKTITLLGKYAGNGQKLGAKRPLSLTWASWGSARVL